MCELHKRIRTEVEEIFGAIFFSGYPETAKLEKLGNGTVQLRSLDFTQWYPGGILHTKTWVVDKKHYYVGSANFDWRSLTQVSSASMFIFSDIETDKVLRCYWEFKDFSFVLNLTSQTKIYISNTERNTANASTNCKILNQLCYRTGWQGETKVFRVEEPGELCKLWLVVTHPSGLRSLVKKLKKLAAETGIAHRGRLTEEQYLFILKAWNRMNISQVEPQSFR